MLQRIANDVRIISLVLQNLSLVLCDLSFVVREELDQDERNDIATAIRLCGSALGELGDQLFSLKDPGWKGEVVSRLKDAKTYYITRAKIHAPNDYTRQVLKRVEDTLASILGML